MIAQFDPVPEQLLGTVAHTYLGLLPVVGEVVQAVDASGWEVLHLQGRGIPVLVLRARGRREKGRIWRTRVRAAHASARKSTCVRMCAP